MEKLKTLLPFLLLLVVAASVIVWLFPVADPYGGIRTEFDAEEAIVMSRQKIDSLSVDIEGLFPSVEFRLNRMLIRQVQEKFGVEQSNVLFRTTIPAYYWEVRWRTQQGFSFASNEAEEVPEDGRTRERIKGEVLVRLDTRGRILFLGKKIPDSLAIENISLEAARELAYDALRRHSSLSGYIDFSQPPTEKTVIAANRTNYEFIWNARLPEVPNNVQIRAVVSGNVLSQIEPLWNIPDEFKRAQYETLVEVLIIVFSAILIVIMIVLAFRRFRSYEMDFRLARFVGIFVALGFAIQMFMSTNGQMGWEILFPLFIGPMLIGAAHLLIWAVAESVGREIWNEKFLSLDLLSKGHFVHSRVGAALVRGISAGTAALALWLVLMGLTGQLTNLTVTHSNEDSLQIFEVTAPFPLIIIHSLYKIVFIFALFILFGVSFLRRKIASLPVLLIVSSLILGVMWQGNLFPLGYGIIIETIVASLIIWMFCRYDVLAAFVALFTMMVLMDTGAMFASGHPTYVASGGTLVAIFGLLIVGSVGAQFRKREITDFDTMAPEFVKHITERQRLQQELEIARQVQMSFLPKSDPKVARLDICSRCIPAQEVGGDYYDFVHLGPKKLAVAIGDVSGKGTQAAFYMTLAKGFLRALSNPVGSVSQVLTQINKLFYDNVERGAFISMIYGVFDVGRRHLKLTRAGHNPVLIWKAKAKELKVIQPNGLALGLEDGKKFSKTIQEVKIPFEKGDCFVFYTDGFTEAMNKAREEYGEERFSETVTKYAGSSSKEMVDGIFQELKVFMGRAKQHDDMTIVVVRVT